MTTLNINLPESIRQVLDERIQSGRFRDADEYIQKLIREDELRESKSTLDGQLLETDLELLLAEGLESGPAIEVTPGYWTRKRERLLGTQRKGAMK